MVPATAPHGLLPTEHVVPLPGEESTLVVPVTLGEQRYATALHMILRNGRTYGPGDKVPVDLDAFEQLLQAQAVVVAPWVDLEVAPV